MKTFLEHVASDILAKHGTDLSRTAIVFPNKRASLFLNSALARQAGGPMWSPAYTTISDLFRQHSTLQVADPILQVCHLHRVYTRLTGYDETLDHFFGWGQLLLADFDDIDKNMAPADQVFANLRDIHELDDVSYLSPEQREAIRKFFSYFTDEHNSLLKERFLRLWAHIGDIYHGLNESLAAENLAYEGALYRQVAETEDISFDYDRYIFVGFNLLQQVEQRLFTTLQKQQKALFYWDYDHAYLNSEAGHYIRQHLHHFPNELDDSRDDIFRCFTQPKTINFVAAPTENIQARYVSQWLHSHPTEETAAPNTAIVLCNESLLGTVVHSLPDEVQHVNITTGYPLNQSPVASLITQLIALQTIGYDRQRQRYRPKQLNAVLRHPLMKSEECRVKSEEFAAAIPSAESEECRVKSEEFLCKQSVLKKRLPTGVPVGAAEGMAAANSSLFTLHSSLSTLLSSLKEIISRIANAQHSPFTAEALFRAYTLLNRLSTLVDSGQLQVDITTMSRLISQLIQQTTIPFHGEPAIGLQVMGVLETRNLDFDNVLMLSTNEGNMPRGVSDASFIPYSIRKAFGLTTVENKVAIYAYYFYRLLARANNITLVYNNATTDGQSGEMSRFMLQLLVESPHTINRYTISAGHHTTTTHPHPIAKTPAVVEALRRRFATPQQSPSLTPTAINRYQRCPLQFYYNYVEGLREPDETDDDVIDNRVFGNIFHEAARRLYLKMTAQSPRITAAAIDRLLKEGVDVERIVDEAISQELFHITDEQSHSSKSHKLPELSGLQIINRQVIIHYLRTLLTIDRSLAPFTILGVETDVVEPLYIQSANITTTIGGRIDRLDLITTTNDDGQPMEQIRVIDYKTGSRLLKPLRDVDAIFDSSQLVNHNDYYLQALLYARLVKNDTHIVPSLHNSFAPSLPVAPALLFIQHAGANNYNPILLFGNSRINDIGNADGDRFMTMLKEKIEEIFNPNICFTPTDNRDICRTCPYQLFCK